MFAALPFPEINPALFTIPGFEIGGLSLGPFPLRWYALAYIAGLVIGWRYALALVDRPALFGGQAPATREHIDDLLFWATLGVILGGRLGYLVFYQIPFAPERLAQDPMMILRVWEGGMSFHGGLIGVGIALVSVARAHGIKLLSLMDIAAVVVPVGLLFGRIANFINAELYGRHTTASIGVLFPEGRAATPGTPEAYDWAAKEWVYSGFETPRHASQLYEAGLEGFLLLIVLGVLAFRFGILKRPGLATGVFLLGYGLARSIAENFREPDAHIGFLPFGVTMGMLLSAPMWVGGGWLAWRALQSPPADAAEPAPAK